MRFHAEHRFPGSVAAVVAILVDPAFYLGLDLPDLSRPELVEATDDGHQAVVKLRYEFVGSLDPMAQRLLGSGRLAWIQEVVVRRSTATGDLRFAAEKDPKRLHGAAPFVLTADGDQTVRHIDGELVVAVPAIGKMAERRIVPGLLARLDIEAGAIADQLAPGV